MKKRYLTIAICITALLLTSCTKKQSAEDVLGLLQNNQYHLITLRVAEDGVAITAQESSARMEYYFRDGVNVLATSATTRRITESDKRIIVYDNLKLCEISDAPENPNWLSYADFNFSVSGKEEFESKTLSFQEYRNEAQDVTIRFFEKDNKIVGMRILRFGHIFDERIELIDQNVPASVFEIPDDYEIQDNRAAK